MKKLIAILFLALPFFANAQTQDEKTATAVNNLLYVMDVPVCKSDTTIVADEKAKFKYNSGCGDHLFWKVINDYRLKAVPYLLAAIDNTEATQAKLPEGKGHYLMGDVALMALRETIHDMPVEELAGKKVSSYSDSWKFYTKGLKDIKKRKALKEALTKWYDEHKNNLIFEKSDVFGNCTCTGKHPVGGFYRIKKEGEVEEAPKKAERKTPIKAGTTQKEKNAPAIPVKENAIPAAVPQGQQLKKTE